ncbi:hypothetical protein [Pseudomonas sp. 1 R 17]|uniref:hypothetical protein n=1 Tax=Pseudomonas sp. 1 R 17 TaxID=1844091 RepID=UPI001146CDC0|nr:hypothetical protein [Pseudomonas sp. 1 R 17]
MVRELTTKRFWRGLRAMVECCRENAAFFGVFSSMKRAESLVLEPFKKSFQWCPMAFSGYAKVDSNNLTVPPVYVFSKGMGGF